MVAKNRLPCQAARVRMIQRVLEDRPHAPGHRSERRRRTGSRPRPPGWPTMPGVIVLTVKLFGETLEAPRTLAVWQ
ncbi:hypothetical protein EIZ62_08495 [Streptomyces ficellus]|uniref:Uncharacterized protein n=1 Tax=Streptomyces ficellus TaxID=1977088 RepID=A0A6I6F3T5_9ACTN|nr:hypothetical protein EIZ62_08495 [Streptomyces ficellus]